MEQPPEHQKSPTAKDEENILKLWQSEKTFQKSVDAREGGPRFVFNDGPPFANGLPHFGHSLVTAIKDGILRYKTMQGLYVPRRNGWDCHGLPVEFSIEKEFGISGKKQIEELGIEKFNAACRASIFKYKADWESFLTRYGRWSDYEHYYATVDSDYTESVWWILGQINQKGLLYRGLKSVPYCPRCQTPLSNFELNEGYKDDVPDPSVYVLFPLTEESKQRLGLDAEQGSGEQRSELYGKVHRASSTADDAAMRQEGRRADGLAGRQGGPAVSLLAWTTTPWTLPANAALAVAADADYAEVELLDDGDSWQRGERLILAADRLSLLDLRRAEYKVISTIKGREIVENVKPRYEPLYELPAGKFSDEQAGNAYRVFIDDSVSLEDGTGILHVAPRYGETDLNLGLEQNLPLIESVDSSGHQIYGPQEALGKFFKKADELIIADLTRKNKLFAAETATHTYPFCWRCDTPLMYFATTTWFVAVSKIRDQLIKTSEQINWVPANIKTGRWGKWLEGARDWAISRNRYWGAPMPIWVNVDDDNDYIVVDSIEELEQLAGKEVVEKALDQNPAGPATSGSSQSSSGQALRAPGVPSHRVTRGDLDLHRPFIDKIQFTKDGKTYQRIEEVLDCWFESGSMPVAQYHYPFENKEETKKRLTADFITEGLDQTRLWFYVQHVISTILFDKPAFKNVIVTGIIMAADGQKLSKRLKNYPPTEDVFDSEGADVWRLYLLSSNQATVTADYMRFDRSSLTDLKRNVLDTLSNSVSFFNTYSRLDNWQAPKTLDEPTVSNLLDQWILIRLNQTIEASTKSAEAYKIAHAILPVFELIDDMSNWYIRRSRKRFWRAVQHSLGDVGKNKNDTDKTEAYNTLWYVLLRISQLLAPWAPFLTDKIWNDLTAGTGLPGSVHLSDWPSYAKATEGEPLVRHSLGEGVSVNEPDNAGLRLLDNMQKARRIVVVGLASRAEKKIKVRQPLSNLSYSLPEALPKELEDVIAEEVNVKTVEYHPGTLKSEGKELPDARTVSLDTKITPELRAEGTARDLIRAVQNTRKNAGFKVEDRIKIKIESQSLQITEAVSKFKDMIFSETLTVGSLAGHAEHIETVELDGQQVTISVARNMNHSF